MTLGLTRILRKFSQGAKGTHCSLSLWVRGLRPPCFPAAPEQGQDPAAEARAGTGHIVPTPRGRPRPGQGHRLLLAKVHEGQSGSCGSGDRSLLPALSGAWARRPIPLRHTVLEASGRPAQHRGLRGLGGAPWAVTGRETHARASCGFLPWLAWREPGACQGSGVTCCPAGCVPPCPGQKHPSGAARTPPRPVCSSLRHGCFWAFAVLLELRADPRLCPRPACPCRRAVPARHGAQDHGWDLGGVGGFAVLNPSPQSDGGGAITDRAEQVSRFPVPSPWEPGLVSLPPAFREASG